MRQDPHVVSLRNSKQELEHRPIETPKTEIKQKKQSSNWLFFGAMPVVATLFVGGVFIYAGQSTYVQSLVENISFMPAASGGAVGPSVAGQLTEDEINLEIGAVIALVGKHIRLPKDEVPTVATVSEPEKLKDQVFFQQASVGDKVLIYTKARKAYLYNPKDDILIEVAPISTDPI